MDGQSIKAFEKDLKSNLYKVWNRMSSGTYFPPPVKLVEIPKGDGRMRPLGIPTVADRIAQTVAKLYLEPVVEPKFHPDSYGYRPGKSALEVVMTKLHAGGKFDHRSYKGSGGLHGVGVSCVNALSEWMEVEVRRDGTVYHQRYEEGKVASPLEKIGKTKGTGTKVTFYPDATIFSAIKFELISQNP